MHMWALPVSDLKKSDIENCFACVERMTICVATTPNSVKAQPNTNEYVLKAGVMRNFT